MLIIIGIGQHFGICRMPGSRLAELVRGDTHLFEGSSKQHKDTDVGNLGHTGIIETHHPHIAVTVSDHVETVVFESSPTPSANTPTGPYKKRDPGQTRQTYLCVSPRW